MILVFTILSLITALTAHPSFDLSKLDVFDFDAQTPQPPKPNKDASSSSPTPVYDVPFHPFGVKRIRKIDNQGGTPPKPITVFKEFDDIKNSKSNNNNNNIDLTKKPEGKAKNKKVDLMSPPFNLDSMGPNEVEEFMEQIYNTELDSMKLIDPFKRDQMLSVLKIIFKDNLEEFNDEGPHFQRLFKFLPRSYKFNSVSSYLLRYAVMFGAEKILDKKFNKFECRKPDYASYNLIPAVDFLIEHRPFSSMVKILSVKNGIRFDTQLIDHVSAKAHQLYPNMSYFYSVFFKLVGCDAAHLFRKLVNFVNIPDGMKMIAEVAAFDVHLHQISRPQVLAEVALQHPEAYRSLNRDFKFTFLALMIRSNDSLKLEQLINLDPSMATYNYKQKFNAMHVAFQSGSRNFPNTYKKIVESQPQLIITKPPLGACPIELCHAPEALQFLQKFNMDVFFKLPHEDTAMNIIQITFKNGSFYPFYHFIELAGRERVLETISEFWETNDKILAIIMRNQSQYNHILKLAEFFGLNLNAQYSHNNLRGNAMIFCKGNPLLIRSMLEQQLKVDCDAPVTIINPTTGNSRIVQNWLLSMPEH